MFKRFEMLRKQSMATHLTDDERASIRESLLKHMEKTPIRQTLRMPPEIRSSSRALHVMVGVALAIACALAVTGLLAAQ